VQWLVLIVVAVLPFVWYDDWLDRPKHMLVGVDQMNGEPASILGGLFRFRWEAFDAIAGAKYAIGLLLVWWLIEAYGFLPLVAGCSAILIWLSDVPGRRRDRVLGMVAYVLIGVPLTLLGIQLVTNLWLLIAATLVVTFIGTLPMIRGLRSFMVGWVLIFWFLLAPMFGLLEESPLRVVISFLVGAGPVVLLTLLGALVDRWHAEPKAAVPEASTAETPGARFVVGYAVIVALTVAVTSAMGWLWLESDQTLVAQAALFVIGPSSRQTWITAIERAIVVVLAIVVGMLLFPHVEGTVWYVIVVALVSFLTLALMNVNYGAFMFFFMIFMTFWWAESGPDQVYFLIGERIGAELVGIATACLAATILQWWSLRQHESHHVRAQQSGA
jgi:hypothetical protein